MADDAEGWNAHALPGVPLMPRPPIDRQLDLERFELWLGELERERPWQYRLLVAGLALLFAAACGFVALVMQP